MNAALCHAIRRADVGGSFSLDLGRAGRTYNDSGADRRFKPDWALCSLNHIRQDSWRYLNLLPGDTKLSEKWATCTSNRPEAAAMDNWKNPVRQILEYCRLERRRYGFILTDPHSLRIREQRPFNDISRHGELLGVE